MIKSNPYSNIYKKIILINFDNSKRVDLNLQEENFVINFV